MIVCVCHNISEKKIRREVAAGAHTYAELREQLQIGTCCGKCASCARQVLRESLAEQAHALTRTRFIPINNIGLTSACA
jgi:bacterioferritin-associated ferredoxin